MSARLRWSLEWGDQQEYLEHLRKIGHRVPEGALNRPYTPIEWEDLWQVWCSTKNQAERMLLLGQAGYTYDERKISLAVMSKLDKELEAYGSSNSHNQSRPNASG